MKYYAQVNSEEILITVDSSTTENGTNYEVAKEEYLKYQEAPYKYNGIEEKEIEEEIEVIDYDEEGNPIGSHTEIITKTIYVLKEDPNWEEEQLEIARQAKYNEANAGAKDFLESGNALFEFEEGKNIEATDGNIAKLTAYALAYVTGQLQPTDTVVWNTKEDETVELNAEQIAQIVKGLGFVQASVWSVQFPQYIQAIETAETAEEVNAIEIQYYSEIPVEEE